MTDRYDAVAVRKYQDRNGAEKTAYTNIGTAFRFRDKDGFTVRLNAIPAPADGEYTIMLFPPKPRTGQQAAPSSGPDDPSDSIPF